MTMVLQHLFPHPFLFLFFAAVMASAWFGGTMPGILAVCVSTLAADYFLVPPFHSLHVNATEATYFIAFVICALAASFAGSFSKQSEATLQNTCNQLQISVAERVIELAKFKAEVARLESEKSALSERLETRKLVERAKGILQREHGISENDAYLLLQRQSRQRSKSMKEMAEAILLNKEISNKI
jgi:K+-sensing histidine kinase KdpD